MSLGTGMPGPSVVGFELETKNASSLWGHLARCIATTRSPADGLGALPCFHGRKELASIMSPVLTLEHTCWTGNLTAL